MMEAEALAKLLLIYVVGMGACIGSFLNVVIARLPENESVIRPGSKCPQCKTPISWFDNIPILSYFILMAKCRHCRAPISFRYPVIELLTASLAGALWVRFGLSVDFMVWVPLSACLVAIAFIDIDHWIIPDVIVFPMMAWVVVAAFLSPSITPTVALLGLLPAGLIFLVGWGFEKITGREGLGFGDVKLLALIGMAVGPLISLNILLLSSLQGAVIGIVLRLFTPGHEAQKEESPEESKFEDDWVPPAYAIPFGPFLVLATLQCVLLPHIFGNVAEEISQFLLGGVG